MEIDDRDWQFLTFTFKKVSNFSARAIISIFVRISSRKERRMIELVEFSYDEKYFNSNLPVCLSHLR